MPKPVDLAARPAAAAAAAAASSAPAEPSLLARYTAVRRHSESLAEPLGEGDCQVQSMPDASPVKWHLAHTSWFFETFVLARLEPDAAPFDPAFRVLFNSYYQGVGAQHPRAQRGLVTRPDLARVRAWRRHVDERMARWLAQPLEPALQVLVELGLQHEQQHQELILTDVLHLLSCSPLAPAYRRSPAAALSGAATAPLRWLTPPAGLVSIGHDGAGFAFDNETPRHRHYLRPYAIADRLLTQGEWVEFVSDGGYREPRWWLAAGWDWVRANGVDAPLYWRRGGDGDPADGDGRVGDSAGPWRVFSLDGEGPLDPARAVAHVSYYEADAYARWWSAQHPRQPAARLPTEAEWEHAAESLGPALTACRGQRWQWTASSYLPYPGFVAWDSAVGEYNAKFMVDQMVLRGGSVATPAGHARTSYRNFFPVATRWQFTGVRLARDET